MVFVSFLDEHQTWFFFVFTCLCLCDFAPAEFFARMVLGGLADADRIFTNLYKDGDVGVKVRSLRFFSFVSHGVIYFVICVYGWVWYHFH